MSPELLAPPISCPPDWPLVRLHEIARKIGSGATPTGGQAAYQPLRTGFALIRSQNVFDRAFSDVGLAFISEAQAHGLRGVQLEPHDLLLNITGDGVTFDCFGPLLARSVENELQAQTLATLRDTLLPRLISGQLRLPIDEALAA